MNRSDLHKQQPMEKPSAGAGASAPGGGDGELRDNKHEKKRRKRKTDNQEKKRREVWDRNECSAFIRPGCAPARFPFGQGRLWLIEKLA